LFLCRVLKALLKYRFILGFISILVLFVLTYGKYANSLPLGVHNWAQSDRYSVAVRYIDNTNFFKAQTHNLSTIDGRCGVEFPILQYVSAQVSRIINPEYLPFIYRGLNLCLLTIGFWFFMRKWKLNTTFKFLAGLILFFSPLLFFYAFNFLPDIAGLAFLLIGFAHFIDFTETSRLKSAIYAILFAGIATLIKTTCGIYFLGMTGAIGLHFLKPFQLKKGLWFITVFLLVAATIWSYDYYFFHKVNEDFYSRIFMSKQQPLNTFSDVRGFWKGLGYWHGQYLTWSQTIMVLGLIVFAVIRRKSIHFNRTGRNFLIISATGLLMFFKLMGAQFVNHEYYFIPAVLPLIFILFWFLLTPSFDLPIFKNKWTLPIVGLIALSTITLSVRDYDRRMSSHFIWKHRDIITDIEWLKNANAIISDMGIPKSATIFVGYDAAPNTSLVYFNRLGKAFNHEEMSRDSSNMKYWSERIQPDYYIFPSVWADKLPSDQPWLYNQLVLFAKRPNFIIYKRM